MKKKADVEKATLSSEMDQVRKDLETTRKELLTH